MSWERRIEALLAREAIRDLPVRYCDCVWRDDLEGLVNLFDEDGLFIAVSTAGEKAVRGHAELQAFFSASTNIEPRPYIHNHVVDLIDETTATGRCYLDLRSARAGFPWMGAGYYEDDYVRVNELWKFAARRFHAMHLEEMPKGLAPD